MEAQENSHKKMDEIERICSSLNLNERIVLSAYSNAKNEFSEKFDALDSNAVSKALRRLLSFGLVSIDNEEEIGYNLTDLGERYLERGLPEVMLVRFLSNRKGIGYDDVRAGSGLDEQEMNAAVGILRSLGILDIGRSGLSLKGGKEAIEARQKALEMINSGRTDIDQSILTDFSRRGLITKKIKEKQIVKVTELGREVIASPLFLKAGIGKVTPELILSWNAVKDVRFLRYDMNPDVPPPIYGRKNIVRDFMKLIKDTFYDMGFSEMDGPYVESTFWNFDVMLFRQNHPDRDIQDTFYVFSDDASVPGDLIKSVKKVYENGFNRGKFDRSYGYGTPFDEKQARKCILRGHDTAMTFRYLYSVISKNKEKPARYFALSKVFRNETLDATHLAEFNQVEGFVYDDNLTVRSLVGYLTDFYERIGIKRIRVKPTYNPYTEPSFEIQGYLDSGRKWIEIGNSGIFRPEVLSSFGIRKNVLGWGLALERALLLRLGITDIRQIYGSFADIDFFRDVEERKIFEGLI